MTLHAIALSLATVAGFAVLLASIMVLFSMRPSHGRWATALGWISTGAAGAWLGLAARDFITPENIPVAMFPITLAMVVWGHLDALIDHATQPTKHRVRAPIAAAAAVLLAGCVLSLPVSAQTPLGKTTLHVGAGTGKALSEHPTPAECKAAAKTAGKWMCKEAFEVTAPPVVVPPVVTPPADPVAVLKPDAQVPVPAATAAPATNPVPTLTSLSATEWLVTIPTATARVNVFTQRSADPDLDPGQQTFIGAAPAGTTMFKLPKAADTWLRLGVQNSAGYADGKSAPVALGPITPPVVVPPPPAASEPATPPVVTPPVGAIDMTGARVLTLLDGTAASIDPRLVTQLADGVRENNWKLADAPCIKHADGSDWLCKRTAPDGKQAWVFRLKQGQPLFQGSTLRAELFAGYRDTAVGVREGGDYWMALDWQFLPDMFSSGTGDSISLFDLHGQPGFSGTPASGYHGFAFRLTSSGRFTLNTFAEEGTTPGRTYDVTDGPSNTVIGTVTAQPGGPHGSPHTWVLDRAAQPNVWYRLVVRMKLSAGKDGRTEVWRKKGNGAMVKVVDYTGPNTGPAVGSYRYQKTGIYKFDSTFGASPTRTFYRRSWAILRNEGSVDAAGLMAWMER